MTIKTTAWPDQLRALGVCREALVWAQSFATFAEAWQACERGDWLLWYVGKTTKDRKRLVLTACQCARLALPFVPAGEERPFHAIDTTERWARGEGVSLTEVQTAADAAYAAAADATDAAYYAPAYYAPAYAAYYAAYAAAAAADAADAAYYAPADAAYAAATAADAAYAAYAAATLKQCAGIVRVAYPEIGIPI